MLGKVPSKFFLVSGSAEGFSKLNAFDGALLAAGIGNTNLIKVSSIIPPGAERIEPFRPPAGSLVPIAYATIDSVQPGEIISAAVSAAIPEDSSQPGVIMEFSHTGPRGAAIEIVTRMGLESMELRGSAVKEIITEAVEIKITENKFASAFAGVVLWF